MSKKDCDHKVCSWVSNFFSCVHKNRLLYWMSAFGSFLTGLSLFLALLFGGFTYISQSAKSAKLENTYKANVMASSYKNIMKFKKTLAPTPVKVSKEITDPQPAEETTDTEITVVASDTDKMAEESVPDVSQEKDASASQTAQDTAATAISGVPQWASSDSSTSDADTTAPAPEAPQWASSGNESESDTAVTENTADQAQETKPEIGETAPTTPKETDEATGDQKEEASETPAATADKKIIEKKDDDALNETDSTEEPEEEKDSTPAAVVPAEKKLSDEEVQQVRDSVQKQAQDWTRITGRQDIVERLMDKSLNNEEANVAIDEYLRTTEDTLNVLDENVDE